MDFISGHLFLSDGPETSGTGHWISIHKLELRIDWPGLRAGPQDIILIRFNSLKKRGA
jgi:hypothetical protein